MESVECLVIGAGVVGLAIARALARSGREVVVLESERVIGSGASSRNSEVIHAGIYYPTGLEKTRLCVEGKAMLYAFCREYGVPHRRCGKILVATTEGEIGKLAAIKRQAEANGVVGSGVARARRGACARTGARRDEGADFALDRHRRLPRLHAGLARRRGAARRDAGSGDAGGFRPDCRRRTDHRDRGTEPDANCREHRGQFSRSRRAGAGAFNRRNAARKNSAAAFGQRQLFRLGRRHRPFRT